MTVVDPDEVAVGSVIVVRPGEKIPIDGTVLSGESTLNTAALTGESRPRTVRPGDGVISGCVNEDGLLRITTTKAYDESTVAKILDLVENSSLKKAKVENFITKFARWYTPAVCLAALLLALAAPAGAGRRLDRLGAARPHLPGHQLSLCAGHLHPADLLRRYRRGPPGAAILVKGGNYLEALAHTGVAAFDKTGTLTKGVFAVTRLTPAPGVTEADLLENAALAERFFQPSHQQEPAGSPVPMWMSAGAADAQEVAGQGVRTLVDGKVVLAGNARLMEESGIRLHRRRRRGQHRLCGPGRPVPGLHPHLRRGEAHRRSRHAGPAPPGRTHRHAHRGQPRCGQQGGRRAGH